MPQPTVNTAASNQFDCKQSTFLSSMWPQQILGFRKVVTLFCGILTLLLIYQELVAFAITRPTSNFQEERKLETSDLPEVVLCFHPGLRSKVLNDYGYTKIYYRGAMDSKKSFVGWNGGENETKSSQDILEEVLVVKSHILNETSFLSARYTEDHVSYLPAEMKLRILVFPFGRCIPISPPISQDNLSSLHISFNKPALQISNISTNEVKVFFMDKVNSLRLYPSDLEMMGHAINLNILEEHLVAKLYKTKISRYEHVQGNPLLNCDVYSTENSYNDCVQDELLELFEKELGCQPPLLAKDQNRMCNKKFNFLTEKNLKIEKLFKPLYFHDKKFNCRTPCTTNVFTTKHIQTTPSPAANKTFLTLVFDKTLEVGHSGFSIDVQTFLTRLGGSVSSGRTLLWVLVTFFGAIQVIHCTGRLILLLFSRSFGDFEATQFHVPLHTLVPRPPCHPCN